MKKNGFTLIEILAVIIILGIIVAIGFGVYYGLGSRSKQRIYEAKVKLIETEAEKWAEAVNLKNNVTIIVDRLIFDGFLTADNDSGDVIDPRDNKTIMNCYEIEIELKNNNTEATMYERNAKDCSDIKASQESAKYITIEAQTSPDGDKIEWTEEVTGILDWTRENVKLIASHEFDTVDSITWKIDTKDNQCIGQEECIINGVNGETYLPYVTVTIVSEGKTYIKRVLVRIDKQAPICTVSGGTGTGWKNAQNLGNGVTIVGKCNDQYGSGCVTSQLSTVTYKTNINTTVTPGTVWDKVGNSTRCGTNPVRIDTSTPTCNLRITTNNTPVPSNNQNGEFYIDDVGITIDNTTTYSLSGIANYGISSSTGARSIVVNYNTCGQTFEGIIRNNAGTEGKCSINIRRDNSVPVFTYVGACPPAQGKRICQTFRVENFCNSFFSSTYTYGATGVEHVMPENLLLTDLNIHIIHNTHDEYYKSIEYSLHTEQGYPIRFIIKACNLAGNCTEQPFGDF